MNWYALAITLVVTSASLSSQSAILPGVERLRAHQSSTPVERGSILLRELSCTACHATDAAHLAARPAPNLQRVGNRVTSTWLRRFLLDPQSVKPGTLMPKCLPDAENRAEDIELLVHFLASRGGRLRRATVGVNRRLVGRGRKLFQTIGCAACHASADGRKTEVSNVPLGQLAHKMTIDSLEKFLRDPHAVRPASRMPKLWLDADEARAIAMFLLKDQFDNPQADDVIPPSRPGLVYEYFEIDTNELPDFELLEVKKRGTVSDAKLPGGIRKNKFAVRMRGRIRIGQDGAYVFRVRANDGARLLIDGYEVVADDRVAGKSDCTGQIELLKGKYSFEVQYFQHGKGKELNVTWTEPGKRDGRVPGNVFSNLRGRAMVPLDSPSPDDRVGVDPKKIERGRKRFASLRCASCHEPQVETKPAKALADLDSAANDGCLGAVPAGESVAFALSKDQRSDLRAALADDGLTRLPDPEQRVRHTFAAYNCYACHERGGIGGPEAARYELFTTKIEIDLGDEGKLPPPLTGVGYKIRPKVLEELLVDGKHRIRERFISTRMPGYGAAPAKDLVKHLVAADKRPKAAPLPEFDDAAVAAGKRIVGITGFGCVTCHNVNGDRAAGIPGVDIAFAHGRLTPGWFREFLVKPSKYRTDTRMPGFWGDAEKSPLPDVLDGTTASQLDAVWSYLSLGKSMPAPAGVQPPDGSPKAELIPRDAPIVHRTFMKDVGPRTIVAGFPEKLHVAFDAHAVRLAKVWRGRFFDASGVASGRSGKFLGPLGDEVLDLPAPAFARLQRADAAWPVIQDRARDVGGEFRGVNLDETGAPSFRYRLAGVEVSERPLPRLRPGGASLRRLFRLDAKKPPIDFYFRAWRGKEIEKVGDGTWRSGDVTITLKTDKRDPVRIRDVPGGKELVVLFVFRGAEIRFEAEVRW